MTTRPPYYADEWVTLYHGDCLQITEWLAADVLVTDPPYGRGWRQGDLKGDKHDGIAGDQDTTARDNALILWGEARPTICFGDLMLKPPKGTKLTGVYLKPVDSGIRGAIGNRRRDCEAIYWIGKWPSGIGGKSSALKTRVTLIGGTNGVTARTGHPHTKPLDVLEDLLDSCPPGTVADPFAGSGSTLVAAKATGRKAIGVEIEERYCEIAARRLSQGVLDFSEPA